MDATGFPARLCDLIYTGVPVVNDAATLPARVGGVTREINVALDPDQLAAFGISADQVNAQPQELNANVPGGRTRLGEGEQSIRTLGSAASIEELANRPIGLPGGRWTTLVALGEVTDGSAEPRELSRLDGDPVVGFSVLPQDQETFIAKQRSKQPYRVTSFGNWFRDRCDEADVPGSIHGLRKAGATRLADAGASEWEIASYLAHTDTTQARTYTRKANRSKLADSGFEKLRKMSNSSKKLDNEEENPNEGQ